MERIQRLFTRMAMRELPSEDWLRRLDTYSLARHRLRGNLILAYKMFHSRLDLPQTECLEASAERDL